MTTNGEPATTFNVNDADPCTVPDGAVPLAETLSVVLPTPVPVTSKSNVRDAPEARSKPLEPPGRWDTTATEPSDDVSPGPNVTPLTGSTPAVTVTATPTAFPTVVVLASADTDTANVAAGAFSM